MSYSPDFSSASPATQWVPPATTTPTDYAFQPDTAPSHPAKRAAIPTAPLMQAPPQDVYSPSDTPNTEGTLGASDSYTPAFAQSVEGASADGEQNSPIPFMGNHPTQTALATGVGALGGGVIGGAVKGTFFKDEEATPPASTAPKPTVHDEWEIVESEGFHDDGITPKQIKHTSKNITYTIDDKGVVTPSGGDNTPKGNYTISSDGTAITETDGDVTKTYTKQSDGNIQLNIEKEQPFVDITGKKIIEKQTFLINKSKHTAVELDEKGKILKLITNLDGNVPDLEWKNRPKHWVGMDTSEAHKALESMNLGDDAINEFLNLQKKQSWRAGMPLGAYCRDPKVLDEKTQKLLSFDFNTKLNELKTSAPSSGDYKNWDDLKPACGFKPAVEAAEAAKFDLGKFATKFALPVGIGALVGGAALFGFDFFLQRRNPKTTAEAVASQ
jgi:hypothetical protein